MLDYTVYNQIKKFEVQAAKLGFKIVPYKYSDSTKSQLISIMPVDEMYPIYARDAQIFTGTVEELQSFMHGMEWMKKYLTMVGATNEKTIDRKEKDWRNRELMKQMADTSNTKNITITLDANGRVI